MEGKDYSGIWQPSLPTPRLRVKWAGPLCLKFEEHRSLDSVPGAVMGILALLVLNMLVGVSKEGENVLPQESLPERFGALPLPL